MKPALVRVFLPAIVVIGSLIAVGMVVTSANAPAALQFGEITPKKAVGDLIGLFFVALMTERALEVIVSVLRDDEAEDLREKLATATASASAAAATAEQKAAAVAAQDSLDDYRNDTKTMTVCLGFVLGFLVASAGVRGLNGLFDPAPANVWFRAVDIIVTGATIAGGSDGIHQMVNAVLDFFNMLSAQSNKKTNQAAG